MGTLLARIDQSLNKLSEAERKIGQYILEHAELVPNMTTKDLSKNSGVSESSVVRFCKSIGIGSFKSFKLELVKDLTLADMNITDFSVLKKNDDPYDLFQKVVHVNKSAVDAILPSLDRREYENAVDLIGQAERLVFFGVGGSATAAFDGSYKFARIGYPCSFNSDFHFLLSTLTYLSENDVFIAISMSGKTKDVLELVRFAKKRGVKVIAITNIGKSPLYKEADVRLCTPTVEHDFRIGSIPSKMTQQTIIDALYLSIFHIKGDGFIKDFQESRNEVLRIRR